MRTFQGNKTPFQMMISVTESFRKMVSLEQLLMHYRTFQHLTQMHKIWYGLDVHLFPMMQLMDPTCTS